MLSIRKVRLLITARYIAMQSYECVIISKMFLIYSVLMGAMVVLWSFLGVLKHLLAPPLRCPCLLRLKKNNSASVFRCASCHCGWHRHTRGYAPDLRFILIELRYSLHSDRYARAAARTSASFYLRGLSKACAKMQI